MPKYIVSQSRYYHYWQELEIEAESAELAREIARDTHPEELDVHQLEHQDYLFSSEDTQLVGCFGIQFFAGEEASAISKPGFRTQREAAEVAQDVLLKGTFTAELAHVGYSGVLHLPYRLTHALVFEPTPGALPSEDEHREWVTAKGHLWTDPGKQVWETVQEVLGLARV